MPYRTLSCEVSLRNTCVDNIRSLVVIVMVMSQGFASADSPPLNQSHWRHPVAMIKVDGKILTANRRSGTISVVSLENKKGVDEVAVGSQLSDLIAVGDYLVCSDEAKHQVILLNRAFQVLQRVSVASGPVELAWLEKSGHIAVSCVWSRCVDWLQLKTPTLVRRGTTPLPFAPRKLLRATTPSTDALLLVADSFGGHIAVFSIDGLDQLPKPTRIHPISGHNIRGLALRSDRTLLITHQFLRSSAATDHENVFWGSVIRNELRSIPLSRLTKNPDDDEPDAREENYPISQPRDGNGDPSDIVVSRNGATVVALSGVSKVSIRPKPSKPFETREVGAKPTALVFDKDEKNVFVANTFDDTISVIDLATLNVTDTISLGKTPKLTEVDHGERLFFDARLSLDGWYSCHSCHTDGHSNGLLNDNFGDGSFGAPKRILSLLGTGTTGPWAWNGKAEYLPDQIRKSIEFTMQGEEVDDDSIRQLTSYVKSLMPPPVTNKATRETIARGRQLFEANGCIDCHAPPSYTTPNTYNVNLSDQKGNDHFNPPSLRGVAHRGPFFHDNRANSLRDVFKKYRHGLDDVKLSPSQLADLIAFLSSL
ncbi:MAG: YVTN family beta-propeller domain-containing protein [Planctomycetaceae bacterium]|nr:YVTN family beta-propeller domain-containing protein [Planctomycetaceae bacterium]